MKTNTWPWLLWIGCWCCCRLLLANKCCLWQLATLFEDHLTVASSLPCAGAWQTNVIVTPHDVDNNNVDDVGQGERQRYIEWDGKEGMLWVSRHTHPFAQAECVCVCWGKSGRRSRWPHAAYVQHLPFAIRLQPVADVAFAFLCAGTFYRPSLSIPFTSYTSLSLPLSHIWCFALDSRKAKSN